MCVEDVMFVDETKLVSLEYIFYQTKGAAYAKITRKRTNANLLKTEGFLDKSGVGENRHYRNDPASYIVDNREGYLARHQKGDGGKANLQNAGKSSKSTDVKFLDTEHGEAKVEALISLWKIDEMGRLSKDI